MKKPVQILLLSGFLLTFIVTKQLNVMQDTEEIWKDIAGYENYQVSNLGQVKNHKTGRILKQCLTIKGYPQVNLCKDGFTLSNRVHRLVGIQFIPNINNLPCLNHKDLNKQNNHVSNLEWCTNAYNIAHAFKNKSPWQNHGSDHHNSKLDDNKVLMIRKMYRFREFSADRVADIFGIDPTTVYQIVRRKTWTHI